MLVQGFHQGRTQEFVKEGLFFFQGVGSAPIWGIKNYRFYRPRGDEPHSPLPKKNKTSLVPTKDEFKTPKQYDIWAENLRMVDIEINVWSSLNLETNLILYLYPEKCLKFYQSESRI